MAKVTCQSCQNSFATTGNLSRHYSFHPDHRPEPVVNSKEAVSVFLAQTLSPYHRRARIRELFTSQLTDHELVEFALPRIAKVISTSCFVYEKCKKKSGEIGREAAKDEFNELRESLHWTFPSLFCDIAISGHPSALRLLNSDSKKATPRRQDMCTPDRRFLQFVDDRSDRKSLLEEFIISNEKLVCEVMLDCCDGRVVKNVFMPLFVKKHLEAFLEFGVGIVSSFSIGQNQLNSILRGHWGKKLAQKTGLNPILPRYDKQIK